MRHLIIIAVLLVFSAGCQREDVIGAEGVTVGDLDLTRRAVRLVLLDERAMIHIDRNEGDIRLIEARYADGRKVAIDMLPLSPASTRVTVQVGRLGHAQESIRLLSVIQEQVIEVRNEDIRSRGRAVEADAAE